MFSLTSDLKFYRQIMKIVLYSFPSIIRMIKPRRMGWAGHVGRMGRGGMHIGYWWESKKRPRRRWMDNIKMVLREIGWDCVDWIDVA
jgi:hypothetical protein